MNLQRLVPFIGMCLLVAVIGQTVRYCTRDAKPQGTQAEAPDDPPEVAEQKARAVVAQFFDAGLKRDPDTALKLVDVPWIWDGNKYAENESRAEGVISDRADLERRLTRSVLKPNTPKYGEIGVKITGARRWSVLKHAIPWAEDTENVQFKNELSAIADANGWLVQVEVSYQSKVLVKPQILAVVAKGEAKIRGGWFRQGQEEMERLIVQ
jgi:hypothetical protein